MNQLMSINVSNKILFILRILRETQSLFGFCVKNKRETFTPSSLRSFSSVAFSAEHLAVVLCGTPAVAPRRDVVALHEIEIKLFLAERADVFLSFPHGEFDVVGEGAEVKGMLVAGEDVGDDARFLLHLTVAHQSGDFFFQRSNVERLRGELVVEACPV